MVLQALFELLKGLKPCRLLHQLGVPMQRVASKLRSEDAAKLREALTAFITQAEESNELSQIAELTRMHLDSTDLIAKFAASYKAVRNVQKNEDFAIELRSKREDVFAFLSEQAVTVCSC